MLLGVGRPPSALMVAAIHLMYGNRNSSDDRQRKAHVVFFQRVQVKNTLKALRLKRFLRKKVCSNA